MQCFVCARETLVIHKVNLNGKIIGCCNDTYCQEQLDDYLDNTVSTTPRKLAINNQQTLDKSSQSCRL